MSVASSILSSLEGYFTPILKCTTITTTPLVPLDPKVRGANVGLKVLQVFADPKVYQAHSDPLAPLDLQVPPDSKVRLERREIRDLQVKPVPPVQLDPLERRGTLVPLDLQDSREMQVKLDPKV